MYMYTYSLTSPFLLTFLWMGIGCVCFFLFILSGWQCLYLHKTLFRPLLLSIFASFFIVRIHFPRLSLFLSDGNERDDGFFFIQTTPFEMTNSLLKKRIDALFCIAICVFFIRSNVSFLIGVFFSSLCVLIENIVTFFVIQKYITIHIDSLTMAFFRYYNSCIDKNNEWRKENRSSDRNRH